MADTYSNYLKVILYPGDITEINAGISRNSCFTVQHFNYESKRFRSEDNNTNFYAEEPTVLEFTIRINTPETGKELYNQIQKHESFGYSFLFNATFSVTNTVESYEDAMVARGHIIDIEEVFASDTHNKQQEQMLMNVKLLLNTITFIGKQRNQELTIN